MSSPTYDNLKEINWLVVVEFQQPKNVITMNILTSGYLRVNNVLYLTERH